MIMPSSAANAANAASQIPELIEEYAMKSDSDIQRDVEAELRWTPNVDERDIAVKVIDGEVTLTGFVPSYLQKLDAESAVKRVAGVCAIANDIQVRLPATQRATDPEIARQSLAALKSALPLSWQDVKLVVDQGIVRLEGTVEWQYEREGVEAAVRRVNGVVSVVDSITVKPRVNAGEIKRGIEDAFRRNAVLDAHRINVEISGSQVTLRGEVHSWAERDQAQQTAWFAPGVVNVKNDIIVRP
jgi:osmotically-inducible protein OsmY